MGEGKDSGSPGFWGGMWSSVTSTVDAGVDATAGAMVKYTPGLAHAVVDANAWLEDTHALERTVGSAQAIGSGAAAYATAPLALTGYGAVVPAYFADQAIAGARTAYEGKFVDSFGHQAFDAAGMPILATAYDFADVIAGVPALMKGGYTKLLDLSKKMAGETGSVSENLSKLLSEGLSSSKFSLDELQTLRKTLTDPEEIAAVDKVIAEAEAKAAKDGVTATKSGEKADSGDATVKDCEGSAEAGPTAKDQEVVAGSANDSPLPPNAQAELPISGDKGIPQELYDKLRKQTPSKDIRDMVNKGKTPPYPDPALPGLTVDGPLAADHVVPMKKIVEMPGFNKLSPDDQLKVLNNPENFVGLSKSANSSKGTKSFEEWTEHKGKSIKVDPEFRQQMMQREQQLNTKLQSQINGLQPPPK